MEVVCFHFSCQLITPFTTCCLLDGGGETGLIYKFLRRSLNQIKTLLPFTFKIFLVGFSEVLLVRSHHINHRMVGSP